MSIRSIIICLGLSTLLVGGFAQEVQVSVDSAESKLVIDKFLSQKLGLYQEYKNFEKAWIFKMEDGNYRLEIYHYDGNILKRDRQVLNPEAYEAYKAMVSQLIRERINVVTSPEKPSNSGKFDQSGRTNLIINNAFVSAAYYGPATLAIVEPNDSRAAVGLYLLTASAGFFTPLLVTQKGEVTKGEANLNLYGITRGIAHGIFVAGAIDEDPDIRATLFSGMAFSVAEGIIGYHVAKKNEFSAGTSAIIGVMGDAGTVATAGLALIAQPEPNGPRLYALAGLVGGGLGLYGGYKLSQTQSYSVGDARAMRSAQVVGSYLPLGFLQAFDEDGINTPGDARLYTALGILGGLGGSYLNHKITEDVDFSAKQGLLIQGGTVASAGLAAGLTYLVSPEGESRPLLLMTGLGGLGGYLLITNVYKKSWRNKDQGDMSSFYMQVHPEGLVGGKAADRLREIQPQGIPAVSMGWRF
ncbi:MAG: hypothetical protein MRZ79_20210 [Bacteroidia bacterium]|nr:hypothetical protein [Bacteroidia bacterium]